MLELFEINEVRINNGSKDCRISNIDYSVLFDSGNDGINLRELMIGKYVHHYFSSLSLWMMILCSCWLTMSLVVYLLDSPFPKAHNLHFINVYTRNSYEIQFVTAYFLHITDNEKTTKYFTCMHYIFSCFNLKQCEIFPNKINFYSKK